jgi:hypothetical protein
MQERWQILTSHIKRDLFEFQPNADFEEANAYPQKNKCLSLIVYIKDKSRTAQLYTISSKLRSVLEIIIHPKSNFTTTVVLEQKFLPKLPPSNV